MRFSKQWVTRQTGGQKNVAWIVASSPWVLIELVYWNVVGIYGPNNITFDMCNYKKTGAACLIDDTAHFTRTRMFTVHWNVSSLLLG